MINHQTLGTHNDDGNPKNLGMAMANSPSFKRQAATKLHGRVEAKGAILERQAAAAFVVLGAHGQPLRTQ